jgi:predicted secreted protein
MRSVTLRSCAAALAAAIPAVPTNAATPPLIWRDVARLHILCLVAGGADGARICAHARDIAAAGAPVPVSVIAAGDPAVLAPDSLTLLVHVAIDGRLAALSVRPFRNDGQAGQLFGAAPRAVAIGGGEDAGAALARPLRAALAETLPWLAMPAGPRPLHP